MVFIIDGVEEEKKVELKLEHRSTEGRRKGMVYLLANGKAIMGFSYGKFRLFSDAYNCEIKGIDFKDTFIEQDQRL